MKIVNLKLILFPLLFVLCSCSKYSKRQAEKDIENGVIKILLYGDYVRIKNCDKADAKFNITHERAGVGPTKEINEYRAVVEKYLQKKYGDDFWEQYAELCDSIK